MRLEQRVVEQPWCTGNESLASPNVLALCTFPADQSKFDHCEYFVQRVERFGMRLRKNISEAWVSGLRAEGSHGLWSASPFRRRRDAARDDETRGDADRDVELTASWTWGQGRGGGELRGETARDGDRRSPRKNA